MSIAKHIKEHEMLGITDSGPITIVVGEGGNFSTMDDALAYLYALPASSLFETLSITGSIVAPTRGDYALTGVGTAFTSELRRGDFVSIDGDANGSFDIAPIYYPVRFLPSSDTTLWLTECVAGASAGTTLTAIRPKKFVLKLQAGDTELAGSQLPLPNGIDLLIVGQGSGQTSLYCTTSTGAASIIQPRYGKLAFESINITCSNLPLSTTPTTSSPEWNSAIPSIQDASLMFSMENVKFEYSGVTSLRTSVSALNNVQVFGASVGGAPFNLQGDSIYINGYVTDCVNAGDALVAGHGGRRNFRSRDCYLLNSVINRAESNPAGAGGALEWAAGSGSLDASVTKTFVTKNVSVIDLDQGNAGDYATILDGSASKNNVKHIITGLLSDNTGPGGNLQESSPTDNLILDSYDRSGVAL